MANPLKKLLGQTAIYGLSSMLARLLNFLLVPIYTRVFAPDAYGVVTELYAYAAFIAVFLTFGFETAYFRFAKENESKVFASTTGTVWLASLGFFLVVWLGAGHWVSYLGKGHEEEYLSIFAAILAFDAMAAIPLARMRYQQKAMKFAALRFSTILLNIVLNLYWLKWAPGSENLGPEGIRFIFYANLIASGLLWLFTLPPIKLFSELDKGVWTRLVKYSWPLWLGGFAGVINETLDRALLANLLPEETASYEVGVYGACYKLAVFMTLFVQAFRMGIEPFYFQNKGESNDRKNLGDVAGYFFLVGCFIFLVITGFMDWFKHFIGEEYHGGLGVVPILLAANLFLGLYINLSAWYKLSDQTRFGAFFSLVGALITLAVNFWGISRFGYWASAWATLFAYFTMCLLSFFIGQARYNIPYPKKKMGIYALTTMGLYFAAQNLPISGILSGFLGILVFAIVVMQIEKDKLRFLQRKS